MCQKIRKAQKLLPLFSMSLFVIACGHIKKIESSEPMSLQLKSEVGRQEIFKVKSYYKTTFYEKGQKLRERDQEVVFQYETKTLSISDGIIEQNTTVTQKEGFIPLHEMAYPELKEELKVQYKRNGEVVQVGEYPKESLWYLSYLPLPQQAKKIGESWTYEHSWISEEKLPLKIQLKLTLVRLYQVKGQQVAEIELSGETQLGALKGIKKQGLLNLESHIKGGFLFSLTRGSLLWSYVSSEESMGHGVENHVKVRSCSLTVQKSPVSLLNETELSKSHCSHLPSHESMLKNL